MNKTPHDYLFFVPIAMDLDLQNEELDQHLVGLCDWFTLLPKHHLLWLNSKKLSISDLGYFLQGGFNAEIERRGWATDLEAPYMYQEELH